MNKVRMLLPKKDLKAGSQYDARNTRRVPKSPGTSYSVISEL